MEWCCIPQTVLCYGCSYPFGTFLHQFLKALKIVLQLGKVTEEGILTLDTGALRRPQSLQLLMLIRLPTVD